MIPRSRKSMRLWWKRARNKFPATVGRQDEYYNWLGMKKWLEEKKKNSAIK